MIWKWMVCCALCLAGCQALNQEAQPNITQPAVQDAETAQQAGAGAQYTITVNSFNTPDKGWQTGHGALPTGVTGAAPIAGMYEGEEAPEGEPAVATTGPVLLSATPLEPGESPVRLVQSVRTADEWNENSADMDQAATYSNATVVNINFDAKTEQGQDQAGTTSPTQGQAATQSLTFDAEATQKIAMEFSLMVQAAFQGVLDKISTISAEAASQQATTNAEMTQTLSDMFKDLLKDFKNQATTQPATGGG